MLKKKIENDEETETLASDMIFLAILERIASEKQHYVNKMEDNWICKEMMACIQDASYELEDLEENQKANLKNIK